MVGILEQQEDVKHRQIRFSRLPADQARAALFLLSGIDGVIEVRLLDAHALSLCYRLQRLTLKVVEESLQELGFHLDNSLFCKLKRALVYYAEETECINRGTCCGRDHHTREVFVQRYDQLRHGCRDPRPEYWRRYL